MANKTNTIIIRVNDIDLAVIKQKAQLSQMSVSEYLRVAGTQKRVDGFNKMSIQNDIQVEGQISIQDILPEEPKQETKQEKKTKTAKKATSRK